MNNSDSLKRGLWTILAVTLVINWFPVQSRAEFSTITPSDLAYSEPFELTGSIMEIDYGKNMLVSDENQIFVINLMIGTELINTVLSDTNGRAILFDSLERGQTIRVSGMKLPDGRVIAEELVRLSDRTRN